MSGQVRLILTLHNHQPVGNFDGVFEAAFQDSYAPFLNVLQDFPDLPVVLHFSGSLLDWLAKNHPEYVARVREYVQRGQIEILGGPYYEPILSAIPRRDRIGQIQFYKQHLEELLGAEVRGMWVPERVWEQSFAGDIVEAGIEYSLLDDTHFRNAGLNEDELNGYFLTEESGRLLKVFAGSERLRYLIPYADPQDVIGHCRQVAERYPNAVLIFGDDGEKLGAWPGSNDHVYRDGWLRRFFTALRENKHWLHVTTLAETVDRVSPLGKVYLPDASYREMTEWALPTEKQTDYRNLVASNQQRHDWHAMRQFVRAGFWRNFLVKYPEANEMYARMIQISQKLDQAVIADSVGTGPQLLAEARRELYRGQCNCPYWHGAFGGLYLPHLRNAIYGSLISADSLLERAAGRRGRWVDGQVSDFNLDARKEICLSGDRLVAFLAPGKGGHLYELDVRQIRTNLLATLNRRPEPYHERIRQHAGQAVSDVGGGVDPNGGVRFKQPDLDRKLQYDPWPRKSLVDHFLQPGLSHDQFIDGHGEIGDFVEGVYLSRIRRSSEQVEATMVREGRLGPYQVKISKTVLLEAQQGGTLEIHYALENLPAGLPFHFGVEFNFAAMAAGAHDRYYYDGEGHNLGTLESVHSTSATSRMGLVDEWLGLDVSLDVSKPTGFWTQPIQTVSQSESGYELVHQSCSVMPHWEFIAPADGRWTVKIVLSLDTSAAQARELAERSMLRLAASAY
ncbi:alpha-amylase/4-alpha-glucanotransferase domain-containing protein [Schlesneria sp. DSM 10557]|uniref:alpha-amylase/4-alpha-glucanotransferase domain-containing protein n=1 Tax=Schlesneria sp. DSM 10557 TaxID=3044399 RepID=UPI0035A077B9